MASKSIKKLGLFQKSTIFDKGLGALLPEAYKKFYKEWKETEPTAVHSIPETGNWKRDEITGEMLRIQNVPIPVFYPKEHNAQMWGGEGVVQGFQVRNKYKRRVPHFWIPLLKRSVVYSEVLDQHISVIVTDRTISLINAHYGFDHYLLKTPACDLKSLLPLGIKRKILQELENNCPTYNERPELKKDILHRYKSYLSAYTPDEIKWYGYSFSKACDMIQKQIDTENQPIPLKHIYRSQLIEKLNAAKLAASEKSMELENTENSSTSWLGKINPFGKKHET